MEMEIVVTIELLDDEGRKVDEQIVTSEVNSDGEYEDSLFGDIESEIDNQLSWHFD